MDNIVGFGKRNLPKRKVSKNIYIFCYNDSIIFHQLKSISKGLCNIDSSWLIKYFVYDSNITYPKILKQIKTPYHTYDKVLDKVCIINRNNSIVIENSKIPIEYFSNIDYFQMWLNCLYVS